MTYGPLLWVTDCFDGPLPHKLPHSSPPAHAHPVQAVLPTVVAKLTDQLVQEWAMLLGQLQVGRPVCSTAIVMALECAIASIRSQEKVPYSYLWI